MLKETAVRYYSEGYNCAESLIRAANEIWKLGLDEKACHLAGGLGGGLQIGDVCGALTGAVCALSCLIIETRAHDCPQLKPLTQKVVLAIQEQLGSRRCDEIKPRLHTAERRCSSVVEICAEVLESVLDQEGILTVIH